MSSIVEILKKNRPNVSQSTLKTYQSGIRSIGKHLNVEVNSPQIIVDNIDAIINYLNDKKLNVRKTKMSALIVFLDEDTPSEQTSDVINRLRTIVAKDKLENEENEIKQSMTERQKKNYISWDEVLKIYESLKTEAEPLFKLNTLTVANFRKLMNYVLLSCYVLIPPRRSLDYTAFKIRNFDTGKDNYMLPKSKKNKSVFVFNQYKNSSRMGPQEILIPNTLKTIIQKWTLKNPYDHLLTTADGKPVTQTKINAMLNDIFQKNISSTLLRHIWVTNKYGHVDLEELHEDANKLGQSNPERLLKYVDKEVDNN